MTGPHTNLYTDAATGELHERRFRLLVVAGPDQGKSLDLEGGTTTVGTHPDVDLVLTDDRVSRYHLELSLRRDGLRVTDLESTNGTVHRGARIGSITLTEPTRLRLGKNTEIEIVPIDEALALEDFAGDRLGGVLGASPLMRQLFALLSRVAPTEATLLLEGETGTGKEAIAEAVHALSPRAGGPFVVVDCGAIPHELIGSELFGHTRGAFTGAAGDKAGLIESASGGTLFLDEIGELALDLQPQLLRVLDKREVRRIGETRAVPVDIRVVAATHRDLKAMVGAGQFREDLYYRLAVVRTVVPPLRKRLEDLPLLARHFATQLGRGEFEPSAALEADLRAHTWPGNVRELRNVVERALSLGDRGALQPVAAPAEPLAAEEAPRPPSEMLDLPFKEAKARLIEGFERDYLVHLLERHQGNISRAAAEAGIDRNYIHRLVKKYALKAR
ncbi:MAG TPA: sigma 54-interacting transcriptional regulator [Kofleriaceae bacterium]|nr:sigma 54-interacting transcriptional regulator [Kofleriaceae bacterium]